MSLCNRELSQSTRLLLAEVITGLGTPDAAIAGLNLIHDDASPPIPFSLMPFHENAFFEHRPYGTGGAFTRIPRSATEIRRRLFEMVLNDRSEEALGVELSGANRVVAIGVRTTK